MSSDVKNIIGLLKKHKNILLYGPPGTGKTHILSQIVKSLKQDSSKSPTLNLGDSDSLFGSVASDDNLQEINNAEVDWITFHQNYNYQDFILGKRPKPLDGGMILEPYLGKLMDNILVASKNQRDSVIIIDEINRANVGKVFGEFITFLDSQYRGTIDGNENDDALTLNLAGLEYIDGVSEPVKSLKTGEYIELPNDWKFPENVYLIATMNSVDKAALPLDAAMLRRFHQIEVKPDISLLAEHLGFELNTLPKILNDISENNDLKSGLLPTHIATLILDKVNWYIAREIGGDFEIGHSVFWSISDKPEQGWLDLIDSWDNKLLPLLKNRLLRAQSVLSTILKIEESEVVRKAFSYKESLNPKLQPDYTLPIICKPLSSLDLEDAKYILIELAL